MKIFWTYDELLTHLRRGGHELLPLGGTPDGSPLVAVRTGGDKLPAVLITAGSHSTEHAGVSAAVELAGSLDTPHQVYVVPTRDPIGLNGFAYALELGLGHAPDFSTFDALASILRESGTVLHDADDFIVALIGDYGYACPVPRPDRSQPQNYGYKRLQRLAGEQPDKLEPLRGRRLFMAPGQPGIEGSGDFGRAYTLIIGLDGEVLHLNRFHDTTWAPAEPRAVRDLMAQIEPGISFDIHESQLMEDRFWLSARRQEDPEGQVWEERAAQAVIRAVVASGARLANDADVSGGAPLEQTWFTRSEPGVYWLDATVRGEGLNLMDYASRHYGMAFGTEMGMYGRFADRVRLGMLTVTTALEVFAERHA